MGFDLAEPITAGLPGLDPVDGLVVPYALRDPVFHAQKMLGLVHGGRTGDGGWHVTCPFAHVEHSVRADTGCAYYARPWGAWVCQHGHCAKGVKSYDDFRVALDGLLEAAGLEPLRRTEFPDLPAEIAVKLEGGGGGAQGLGAARRFVAEHVFVSPEDAWLSLRSMQTLSRRVVEAAWRRELRPELEWLDDKGKVRLRPIEDWFRDVAPGRVVDAMTYWPGMGPVFEHERVVFVNRYAPGPVQSDGGRRVTNAEVAPWLGLVARVMAGESPRIMVHVLDWLALVVGEPGTKPAHGVLVQGRQGIGKDLMMRPVVWACGAANVAEIGAEDLHSEFTEYAEKRLILVAELKQTSRGSASGHDQYNRLKRLIDVSRAWFAVNPKYGRTYRARNTAAVHVSTNDADAAALAEDDRRLLVVMSTAVPEGGSYYLDVAQWLASGGEALVAAWLAQRCARALGAGTRRRHVLLSPPPRTAGRATMLEATRDPVEAWIGEQIEQPASADWPDVMSAQEVHAAVTRAVRSGLQGLSGHLRVPSVDRIGRMLGDLGAVRLNRGGPVRVGQKWERLWALRRQGILENCLPEELARIRQQQGRKGLGF
jgi:hypothetical protein